MGFEMTEVSVRSAFGYGLAACAAIVATAAASQAGTPVDAIHARQGQFREIGTAFKAINDELKKDTQGKFAMATSARQISGDLRQVRGLFPAGSNAGAKTAALPAIWTDHAKFDALNAASTTEADKLVAAIRTGDATAIRTQAKVLGASCQTCHQQFRARD